MLPEVDGRRVGRHHRVGPHLPHQSHQPAPQLPVVFELAVTKPQPVVGFTPRMAPDAGHLLPPPGDQL